MDLRLLPYQPDRDVYRLLGVPPSARTAEIAAACRTLARAFHPDRNDSRRATEEMQVVNAVRALLTDPQSRAEYDRERHVFWSRAARSTVARPADATPTVRPATRAGPAREAPAERQGPGRPKLSRTARAAMAGLLAALRALHPTRCGSCGEWIEADHRFCGACGAPARTHLQVSPRPSG
ncbi:MAG: J domain-containing protein [Chloroflexota bacterium]|nr:J domain-containing protein [Chloroflexota bacterium]